MAHEGECVPDMKPFHFIDRKDWAINDGRNPSWDLNKSLWR
jgi:hypothetical protein